MRLLAIAMLWAAALPAQTPSNTSKVYSTAKRPRALVLVGDRYHSPVYARDNISKALVRENIPATFIEEVAALNAESLAQHQLLIILRDGMNWPNGYDKPDVKWMTEAQQQAIWDFVNRGGGFLALHNAQGLYPPGGLYYKLFGGDYGGHPEPYTFTVRVENKNHPITAGVEDFEIFDEQHTVKYYLDREHLLLRSIARNNLASEAGWWREQGQGRFAYLAPGHTPDALGHPMMQRLMRNAMNWLLRLE
ncbi:MAG: ThuA domain-containing protein [Candidatus Solibacter usitatus]|nr:ThuA domain-containing protein [Candidatus Solibacter usitatus]